jgi:Ferritin-like
MMAPLQSPKLIARNVAAVRRFTDPANLVRTTAGNPVSTRLESGIGNCFPGLECDLRNLERRFFPFLEMDIIEGFMAVASVDSDGVAHARASGDLSQANAATYTNLAGQLTAGRSVFVSRLTGTFGILGQLALNLALPALGQRPAVDGDLTTPSVGPGRRPPDAWTAVRLLTEGSNVTLAFVNDGSSGTVTLTAKRARYLDENGTLAAAFLPGELSQSLCSPWTHDFRDCGCFYWASNHPDIVQPVLPANTPPSQPWNAAVPWERGGPRTVNATPPDKATQDPAVELRHYEINNRWQELHFVVGRREITAPFAQTPVVGTPFASRAELMANLNYAAGVELAVAQEYLAAAYSLKPDTDPSLGATPDLLGDVQATRAELMRIAIGEMRHIRAVNDVIRGLSDPGTFEPALRVASQLPHQNPGPFQPVTPRAATRQAINDFIEIEAQSTGVDGLYNNILATLQFPPADVAGFVTDEWKQAIRSIIAEGEDHFETFLNIQEWLRIHAEADYLRSLSPPRPPAGNAANAALQAAYASLLNNLFTGYKKGRFLGSNEINAARTAMVAADGIVAKAEAVASQNLLVVFNTPADARFAPIDPPGLAVA